MNILLPRTPGLSRQHGLQSNLQGRRRYCQLMQLSSSRLLEWIEEP